MNAADAFDIGSFDEEDTKGIKVLGLAWPLTPEPARVAASSSSARETPRQPCQLLGLRLLLPRRP